MKRYLIGLVVIFGLLAQSLYAQEKEFRIVFIPKSTDLAFWQFMRKGCDNAVKELGNVELVWRGPAYDDDTDSQIKIVDAYTQPTTHAIVIVPTDRERLVKPLKKASELGIKVVVVDSGLASDAYPFISTNNLEGGKLAGKQMADLLQEEGKVIVFRTVKGSGSTDERGNGFVEYIKTKAPKISILADEYGGGSKGKAQNSAAGLLAKYPDATGIFAVNEASTDGMLRALRKAGKAGKVTLLGFDSSDFLLEGLSKKEISGLVLQDPNRMGYLGIMAAFNAIKGVPFKEKNLYIEGKMVTPDNYRLPEIQALLFP